MKRVIELVTSVTIEWGPDATADEITKMQDSIQQALQPVIFRPDGNRGSTSIQHYLHFRDKRNGQD